MIHYFFPFQVEETNVLLFFFGLRVNKESYKYCSLPEGEIITTTSYFCSRRTRGIRAIVHQTMTAGQRRWEATCSVNNTLFGLYNFHQEFRCFRSSSGRTDRLELVKRVLRTRKTIPNKRRFFKPS